MTYITDGYRRTGRRLARKITLTNLKLGAITSLNRRIPTVECQMTADITKITADNGVAITYRRQTNKVQEDGDLAADAVVVCAGVGSRHIAAQLGDRINVYPVKGYSITVHLDDEASQTGAPWVSLLDDQAKIVTSRLGRDRFRVAGTAEFNGFNRDIRHDRVRPLIDWVKQRFPNVSTSRVVPWAGLRPMMPDMMPRVRKGKRPGVFYNTGHGHLGWTLSCVTAEIVTDIIQESALELPARGV